MTRRATARVGQSEASCSWVLIGAEVQNARNEMRGIHWLRGEVKLGALSFCPMFFWSHVWFYCFIHNSWSVASVNS